MSDTVEDDSPSLEKAVAHAWDAYHAGAWEESFTRWDRVRKLFPGYPPPYVHASTSLCEAGRPEQALALLREGFTELPDDPQIAAGISTCLNRLGRFKELSNWVAEQAPRFPNNPEIVIDFLRLATIRSDHAAVAYGGDLMARFYPDHLARDEGVRVMIADGRLNHEFDRIDGVLAAAPLPEPPRAPPPSPGGDGDVIRKLMLSFESLGENCEFGLVQRHYGVEPLGLLRWTATTVTHLTWALDEDFAGVGTPEHTKLHVGDTEYATIHDRYGMAAHTFIKLDPPNERKIFDKMVARLSYLRNKLIEDLKEGEKTFVYTCGQGAPEEKIRELHRALRRYGSQNLLFVVRSDAENEPATVRDLGDGLLLGYMEKLGPDKGPDGDTWNVTWDNWRQICHAAHELRHVDAPAESVATVEPEVASESLADEEILDSPRNGLRGWLRRLGGQSR